MRPIIELSKLCPVLTISMYNYHTFAYHQPNHDFLSPTPHGSEHKNKAVDGKPGNKLVVLKGMSPASYRDGQLDFTRPWCTMYND